MASAWLVAFGRGLESPSFQRAEPRPLQSAAMADLFPDLRGLARPEYLTHSLQRPYQSK